jgi:glyoxylase-like metal-dependent hydrolase (beta-lactamase superfamily II)
MAGGSSRELRVNEIACGVFSIGPWGRTQTNVYAVRSADSWVLVDAGWAGDGQRIQSAVKSVFGPRSAPSAILLTHVHPDHEGDSRALATDWRCPVYVSPQELPIADRDFSAMRDTAMPLDRWLVLPMMRAMGARRRQAIFDSATLAGVVRVFDPSTNVPGLPGWACLPTPGHTVGHVSFFRAADRVLISGDALVTAKIDTVASLLLGRNGLSGPPWYTTWNSIAAHASIQALAALKPQVLAGGHGIPMSGPGTTEAINDFTQRIAAPTGR